MTPPTIDEFAEYVDDLPRQSPCWGDGILGLYPVLSWLNTHPVVVQRELVAQKGVFFGVMMTARAHHNQVGTAVSWATQYMAGPPGPVLTDPDDLPELFDLAGRAYLMRNLLAEVRQGVRRFEADGTKIVGRARVPRSSRSPRNAQTGGNAAVSGAPLAIADDGFMVTVAS